MFKKYNGKVITPVRLVDKGKGKDGTGKNNHDEKAEAPVKEELWKSDKWAVGPVWRMFLGNPFADNGPGGLCEMPLSRQCGGRDRLESSVPGF